MTERIEKFLMGHPLFDQAVVEHGFTRHLRDYDVIVDRVAPLPKVALDAASDRHSYVEARYRYRFTHCVAVTIETNSGTRPGASRGTIISQTSMHGGEPENQRDSFSVYAGRMPILADSW